MEVLKQKFGFYAVCGFFLLKFVQFRGNEHYYASNSFIRGKKNLNNTVQRMDDRLQHMKEANNCNKRYQKTKI
jgi:hypothetical protein